MKTTVNDDSLKNSLAFSAGLHILFLLCLYFGLPTLFKPLPSYHEPVPFEIVDIADITNTRIKEEPVPPQKPPEPPPKPQPPVQQAPPPPQTPAPPQPQAEAILPKPVEKKAVEPPKKTDTFDRPLKNLEQKKQTEDVKTPPVTTKTEAPAQPQNSLAPTLSNRLTLTEEDALRRQISQCWNMPIGARDAQTLIVEVVINVNPDRTVQSAEVVDKSRMATDSFYRAAAEAALRALYNPKCSPLELPADKYDQWKTIDFTFDPRDML